MTFARPDTAMHPVLSSPACIRDLHGKYTSWFQELKQAGKNFFVVGNPVQRRVGEHYVVLRLAFHVLDGALNQAWSGQPGAC